MRVMEQEQVLGFEREAEEEGKSLSAHRLEKESGISIRSVR